METSRKAVAKLINSYPNDVVLVESSSTAVNSVLRSIKFSRGDGVLVLSTAYSMVCETLRWLETTTGITQVVVPVLFPLEGPERILKNVEQALKANPQIKLAVFSHISSMPSIIEPVTELSKMCHAHGVTVFIDGAHAPGTLKIDI